MPERGRVESAILQELKDLGPLRPRHLYGRIVRYFPQLLPEELDSRTERGRARWWLAVQRAKRSLQRQGQVEGKGLWRITEQGLRRARAEDMPVQLVFSLHSRQEPEPSHEDLKRKLVDIGRMLGMFAQEEHQRYDVVWREAELSPRISHVFEVQHKGKLESALAKLKHAWDTQRSRLFLVIIGERDVKRAGGMLHPYFAGTFHEIGNVTTVLDAGEVERLYRALASVRGSLEKLTGE